MSQRKALRKVIADTGSLRLVPLDRRLRRRQAKQLIRHLFLKGEYKCGVNGVTGYDPQRQ